MKKDIFAETRTDKSKYLEGEEVVISITITNNSAHTVELNFMSSQHYDFIISKDGKDVWRWSQDKMFAMVIESLALKSHETQVYEEKWSSKDASSGRYEVLAMITSQPPYEARCAFYVET